MLSHILISTLILSIAAAPASSTSLEVRTSRRSLGGRPWQRKCKVLKADEWVQFKEGGDVDGVVLVENDDSTKPFDDVAQSFKFRLTGLDSECIGGIYPVKNATGGTIDEPVDGLTNACGVHVHSGIGGCAPLGAGGATGGGHYYAPGFADPWGTGAGTDFKNDYDVLAAGYTAAYGEFTATTGLTLPELLGEEDGPVIVVHGADGGRIACAKLECERKGYDWW
ncbi:hypothetical protein EMIHUDRAFT_445254 [Emiliania huxleyi CCMP1516]|jgi:hypothetical protein|uniref:Superoxide dismutase copper/zinc binding domain-containing protein n=2 Tax=Emiliania huxleyi TaxID=2903 RepID=A0A0D3J139_EMIH1|nr:hypothetical protein EMIHUDRAFT_445254 [Emiliania huxleyi CCMP1516]EOD17224.1 hypothetical protein EMIHUDRAFT_445254 [Emiliania huxleyi CCMP1516]|eukprot:XP_005769653.1 hypothetical protein EMIHUDRAFT_445254 [Emiliania huxleyi CCMP1516]